MKTTQVWPGRLSPLGATFDGSGVNFALFFGARDEGGAVSVRFAGSGNRISSDHVAGADRPMSGTVTCPRSCLDRSMAFGAWTVEAGVWHRFNLRKLLLDPYAKAIARGLRSYDAVEAPDDRVPDQRDSAGPTVSNMGVPTQTAATGPPHFQARAESATATPAAKSALVHRPRPKRSGSFHRTLVLWTSWPRGCRLPRS